MKSLRSLSVAVLLLVISAGIVNAQTWTKLKNQPTFQTDTALLLTDGTVAMHEYCTSNWWRLTPDNTGSYVNGKWSKRASMNSGYGPLYFASAVLADGRMIVQGGEYNFCQGAETPLGAIYDPVKNTWATLNAPNGWSSIGDSPAIVLPNETYLLGQNSSTQSALLNTKNLTWTSTGTGKSDAFSEEGFTLLPDKTVLTVDTQNTPNAEKYYKGKWISAGNTIQSLALNSELEIGPALRRPQGTVFAMGANGSGAGHTAIYTPPAHPQQPGKWKQGPDFPGGNDMADAPAAVLPDGNILADTSPGVFQSPVTFYEFDGKKWNNAPSTTSPGATSYNGRMLVLPTGQVLFDVADGSTIDVEVYNAKGTYQTAWQPTITTAPSSVTRGSTYQISGTQFNGLDAGSAYGDDNQMASSYPLVRITNTATGHVFYERTHDHSTMAIGTGSKVVSTNFDVSSGTETGASTLVVVANGIPSASVNVTVQ